eukprot:scaffold30792_cov63-Phaeocystis_antarctica.AAC.8
MPRGQTPSAERHRRRRHEHPAHVVCEVQAAHTLKALGCKVRGWQLRGELANQRGKDGRAKALSRAAKSSASPLIGAPVAACNQVRCPWQRADPLKAGVVPAARVQRDVAIRTQPRLEPGRGVGSHPSTVTAVARMRVDDELPQEDLHGKVTAKLRTREFLCALEHRQLLAAEEQHAGWDTEDVARHAVARRVEAEAHVGSVAQREALHAAHAVAKGVLTRAPAPKGLKVFVGSVWASIGGPHSVEPRLWKTALESPHHLMRGTPAPCNHCGGDRNAREGEEAHAQPCRAFHPRHGVARVMSRRDG